MKYQNNLTQSSTLLQYPMPLNGKSLLEIARKRDLLLLKNNRLAVKNEHGAFSNKDGVFASCEVLDPIAHDSDTTVIESKDVLAVFDIYDVILLLFPQCSE